MPQIVLVLQRGFNASTALPVASSGALLMAASPAGPGEYGLDVGHVGPDEAPEQAAQLRDGEREQLGRQVERGLFPRRRLCGARRGRRGPAWRA